MAQEKNNDSFGAFSVGCNYWASHAGTDMWSDWRPEVIEEDFKRLKSIGVRKMRCFPLWPVFQPISLLRRYAGIPMEYSFGENPLPQDEFGRAGVSREAMEKFARFADLAAKYNLELIVGLVTGWMSGRLFVPPALEGLHVYSDPASLMWQTRFVRFFVRHFRAHSAIVAWDLGNECNCCAIAKSREEAWIWASTISTAIRTEDSTRPVISGMHSLGAEPTALWSIEDQGELTDILTVHPYPPFTPHCDRDPINTMRNALHATAESVLYSSISGKPCLAEEVGTLCQVFASEKIAGDYLRNILFSLWSHGDRGLLWWCGFDQKHLEKAPYDWHVIESELGLFRSQGNDWTPKPAAENLLKFSQFLEKAPALPPRRREAVCILSDNQDCWGAAYASFILAKQAGFDLDFQTFRQPLREAEVYLLPSIQEQPWRRFGVALMDRVRQGATLYVSLGDALLADARDWFGVEAQTRQQRRQPAQVQFAADSFEIQATYRLNLQSIGAEILAAEPDGNPVFTRYSYGKGTVYFLQVPLETYLSRTPGVFHEESAAPYWKFYSEFSRQARSGRAVEKSSPWIGITEHPRDEGYRYVSIINYSPQPAAFPLQLKPGWKIAEWFHGTPQDNNSLALAQNDAAVLGIRR
jgi:hypothetical protein